MAVTTKERGAVETAAGQQPEAISEAGPRPGQEARKKAGKVIARTSKAGMVGSMAAMLYYAHKGQKKPHIKAGKAFLLFAGVHVIRHIKYLLK